MTQTALTIGIFLLTFLLMLRPPHGINEAWATVGGGLFMLLFRRVTFAQAFETTRQGLDILAFLFTLMLLAALLERSGFFEWAARHAARAADGNGIALFRNVFLLGAVVTALLSLDTTAVILTPITLSFVARLKLPPRPFLIACAFVANAASLLLPVSNLTNLLFVHAFGWSFASFTLRMALPQIAALLVGYAVLRKFYREELPLRFAANELPEPKDALPDVSYFRGAVVVLLAVLMGYFIGSLRHIRRTRSDCAAAWRCRSGPQFEVSSNRKNWRMKFRGRCFRSWSDYLSWVRGVESLGLAAN